MASYAEGQSGAEYVKAETKTVAYVMPAVGEPDYTLPKDGEAAYAGGAVDVTHTPYLEQKKNGEYATGVAIEGVTYAVQDKNGDYVVGVVSAKTADQVQQQSADYVVVRRDEEEYVKQDANGPYVVPAIGDPAYVSTSPEQVYVVPASGKPPYTQATNQGTAYVNADITPGDYVHAV